MSLLHQNPTETPDDAAKGEELTKGSSHIVWAGILAVLLMVAAAFLVVRLGERAPVAAVDVVEVWAHPRHVATSGLDANGAPMQVQHYDQVLLFAHLRIRNQSKFPLTMTDVLANVTQEDGIHSISAGTAKQYDQVFVAYPEMQPWKQPGLSPSGALQPGQTVEGTLIWGIQTTKQQWDARKALDFSVRFQYQPGVKAVPAAAVGEK